MRISLIIPTYQSSGFVAWCLESVFRQTRLPDEVIIIDDGSTDDTAEMIRPFNNRVRYFRQSNGGPAAARNTGIAESTGDLLAFVDIDDLLPVNSLDCLETAIASDEELGFVWGQIQPVSRRCGSNSIVPVAGPGYVTSVCCGLFRKQAFDCVGGFDTSLRSAEDLDWFLRANERGIRFQKIEVVTLFYVLHQTCFSKDQSAKRRDMLQVLKNSIDRKKPSQLGKESDS